VSVCVCACVCACAPRAHKTTLRRSESAATASVSSSSANAAPNEYSLPFDCRGVLLKPLSKAFVGGSTVTAEGLSSARSESEGDGASAHRKVISSPTVPTEMSTEQPQLASTSLHTCAMLDRDEI
jgi:hypothetical protein